MRAKKHKDVEFHVEVGGNAGDTRIFKTFAEAATDAVINAASTGMKTNIDVVVWSPAGARWYGGDDAVRQYKDDPEASIFERIVVRADSQGRIP